MAEHYKVELGQIISQRRKELGLTQKQLADLTHHQEAQTVSRWERGENAPSDLEVVAAALQWTLTELVAGIEPPNPRTARKLGYVARREPSQLDRIEDLLTEIREALFAAGVLPIVERDTPPDQEQPPEERRRPA